MNNSSIFQKIMPLSEFEILCKTSDFIKNHFTQKEIEAFTGIYAIKSLGTRYLVKKIISEIIGEDIYLKTEILNNLYGKPEIHWLENSSEKLKFNNIQHIDFSISHSANTLAVVVFVNYKK